MANENMIKFYRGLVGNLPAAGDNGALYITTDEGAIYYGTGTGMKRLGDFIQVANVASLPEKAHESCLYYCVTENILAKWNGSDWTQINKQPTAEEMKTLLGLGSMAYKSEVVEGDLGTELAKKINDASAANHGHDNKGVIDGITAEKVAAWDAAEGNAKTHATNLNTAMNTRVEALEAIDHSHTFVESELNLVQAGDVAKWNTAAGKAHEHTFVEPELNKIADGDVAKWNGVVADHLTSTDKTNLENAIKEAKKAGTDANTALEGYKVTNDARVLAVEEDVAEIVDGENGILAQAKSYSDGKLATARTEISAEIDGDVAVVNKALEDYKSANDTALAGVKATAEAAAVKTEVETALGGKVDKVAGKDLIATSEIERLATLHNYDDTQVKADIAKKADAEAMTTELGKKVDKVEGYSLVADTEITRLAGVHNYDDTALAGRVTTAEGKITALETESAKHALESSVAERFTGVNTKFNDYRTSAAQDVIDAEQDRRLGVIEGDYLKAADIAEFETKENVKKVSDDLAAYVESNDAALAGVKATAEAARTEEEVNSQIDAKITALDLGNTYEPKGAEDRAKAYADGLITAANLDQYTTEQEVKDLVDGVIAGAVDGDTITGLANLVEYLNTHGAEAKEMGAAIDVLEGKVETIEGKPAYGITATQISNWDGEVGAKALAESKTTTAEVKTQIEAYGYATEGYADGKASAAQTAAEKKAAELDAALKTELQGEIDADVKVVNDAFEGYKTSNDAEVAKKANSADVYAKTEIFTKEEVNAAIATAVESACCWGEF